MRNFVITILVATMLVGCGTIQTEEQRLANEVERKLKELDIAAQALCRRDSELSRRYADEASCLAIAGRGSQAIVEHCMNQFSQTSPTDKGLKVSFYKCILQFAEEIADR